MGVIQNLQMNLDFMFNASSAYKGATKLKGSFTGILDDMVKINKQAEIAGTSLGTTFSGDDIINYAKSLGKVDAGLASLMGTSQFSDSISSSLEEIVSKAFNVASGVKTATEEIRNFTAVASGVAVLNKFGESAKGIASAFTQVGVEIDNANIMNHLLLLTNQSEKLAKKFEDITEKSTDLQKGMSVKQLAQYATMMNQLADAIDRGAEAEVKDLTKQLDVFNYKVDVLNNRLPGLKDSLGNLVSGVKGDFLSALGAVTVVTDAIRAQDIMVQSIHQTAAGTRGIFAGTSNEVKSFTSTLWEMDSAVRDVGFATQVSMTRAAEAMSSLASARVRGTTDDLANMAVTSIQMGQAFGISEGQATDLIRTLNLVGGLDQDQIRGVAEQFADVQATLGLTSEEASEAAATVGRVIVRMSQMGSASTKNAKIVAKEVGKMTASFTRAGMSANDATSMIDRFMDPTKLEDNAFLWHKMGMSVSDGLSMMTGDAAAMQGMNENLLKAAYDLRKEYGNNPLALQAMAEAYGMTIQQVNQLSGEYEQQLRLGPEQRAELEAQATLEKQAAESKASLAKQIDQLANIGNVLMQSFIMPLIDFITPIIIGLSNVIKAVGGFIGKLRELGPVGDFVLNLLKFMAGGILLFVMVTRVNLFKLLSPIKALGGAEGFGGLLSKVKDFAAAGAKAIGQFASSAAKRLSDGPLKKALGGLGDKLSSMGRSPVAAGPAAPAASAAGAAQAAPAAGPGKFMEGISKIPAKTILQLGAALLMLAGAVFLFVLSWKMLTDMIKENDPATLAIGFGMLIGVIAISIGVLMLLAAIAPATAGAILPLAFALLIVAASVAIMVLSLALLLNTIKGMDPATIALGIAILVVALGGLILMALAMAPAAGAAAAGLIPFGLALLMVGGAVVLVGLGFMLMALAIKILIDAVNSIGPAFASNALILTAAIAAMVMPLLAFGAVALLVFIPIALLGVAILALGLGMALAAVSINAVAAGLQLMLEPLMYIGQNSLTLLAGLLALTVGITALGLVALFAALPILALGAGMLMLGTGLYLAGLGVKLLSEGFDKLGSQVDAITKLSVALAIALTPMIIALTVLAIAGVGAVMPLLGLAGAMVIIAVGMMLAGIGLGLVAQGLSQMTAMSDQLVPTALALAQASGLIAVSMLALAAAGVIGLVSLLGLVVIIPVMLLLGWAMGQVANQFFQMGNGIKMFAENIGAVLTGIDSLKQKLDGVTGMSKAFVTEINKMAEALAKISDIGIVGIFGMLSMNLSPTKGSAVEGEGGDMSAVVEKLDVINSTIERGNGILIEIRDAVRSRGSGLNVDSNANYGVV